ncbi:MAG: hypothetical protein AABM29_08510 [Actinomycetota bacterium]
MDRAAAGFLLVLLALGSLWLWIGMPALTLWVVAEIVDTPAQHLTLGLLGVPAGMILFASLLFWINGLYLRVTGAAAVVEEDEGLRRVRGPLEPLLLWSLVIALIALIAWFFFAADGSGPPQMI